MPDTYTGMVKICGIQDASVARAAVAAGAGALGFMLTESRRRVRPDDVANILSHLHGPRPLAVGVVVNPSPADIERTVRETGIDIVQLSGDESPDLLSEIDVRIWKALRFSGDTTFDDACRVIESWLAPNLPAATVMIDAAVPGHYGGTGHRAEWKLAARLAELYPIILAGGLTPESVGEAVHTVRPAGVDVSSGVEVEGAKDPARIKAFVEASQAAFGRLTVSE